MCTVINTLENILSHVESEVRFPLQTQKMLETDGQSKKLLIGTGWSQKSCLCEYSISHERNIYFLSRTEANQWLKDEAESS